MIKFVPVTGSDSHCKFLYRSLKDRPKECFISHRKMPSYDGHVKFVKSKPYKKWFLIEDKGEWVGNCYLSKTNEIGIFILSDYRGKSYGPKAIQKLINESGPGTYFANINPVNDGSIGIFEDAFGFTHIQNTYRLDVKGPIKYEGFGSRTEPFKTYEDGTSKGY